MTAAYAAMSDSCIDQQHQCIYTLRYVTSIAFSSSPVTEAISYKHGVGNRMRSGSALVLAELLRSFFLLDINTIVAAMHTHTQSIAAAAAAAAEGISSTSSLSASCNSSDASSSSAEGDAAASRAMLERQDALRDAVSALPARQVVLTGNPLGMAGARCCTSLSSLPSLLAPF